MAVDSLLIWDCVPLRNSLFIKLFSLVPNVISRKKLIRQLVCLFKTLYKLQFFVVYYWVTYISFK